MAAATGSRLYPGQRGLPTIFDQDVLIYCCTRLIAEREKAKPLERSIRLTSIDLQQIIRFAGTKVHEATYPTADCPLLTKVWPSLPSPETGAASGCRFQGEDSEGVAELLVGEVVFAEHVDVRP